ncbi:MAG: hypothetical protein EHM20_13930 [Alphaproteobacteria bacterium]|nr:MAG: hypothetical protein EHM20_13930 [Alphaproteobacteria bacterium]
MRLTILVCFLLLSFETYAKKLECSANGTDVYYINGILTNDKQNKDDTKAIGKLFDGKENQLDSGPLISGKPPVTFTGIFNPSFGLINAAAEPFAQVNSFEMRTSSSSLPRLTLYHVPDARSSCSLVVRANLNSFEKNWEIDLQIGFAA